MSDHAAFTAQEVEAFKIGWQPKDEFKGKPENWRPAEEYLERGRDLLPIVKAEKAQLEGEVGALRGELAQVKNLLKAQSESTTALVEANTEAKVLRLKEEQKSLRLKLVAARRDGSDAAVEVAIQEELDGVTEQIRTASTKGVVKQPPTEGNNLTPEMQEFLRENGDWFGKDKEKTAVAMAHGEKLRAENPNMSPREIYAAAAKRVKEVFGPKPQQRQEPRVEGGGTGGGTGDTGGGGEGETYSDLPSEVKAAAQRLAPKLVGEGRKFKTLKDYQSHYAREYFSPGIAQTSVSKGAR